MAGKMRKMVLVIDSDRLASDMIVETLLPRGLDVSVAASPDRGVEKARECKPDIVFISLFFSDSNGLKVSRRILSEEDLKKVPVVMLISYRGELDPKYTSTIGIVDVLVKPLKPEDVIAKTKKVLGEHALTAEPAEQPGIYSGEEGQTVPIEEEEVLKAEESVVASAVEQAFHTAAPAEEHDLKEADKEGYKTPDETEEFLKEGIGEAEEPWDNAAKEFPDEHETLSDTPLDSQKEIIPEAEPRRLIAGRNLIVFAIVVAALVIGLGTYGLKKIASRTQKAVSEKVVAAGNKKVASAPAEKVVRPAANARGEGVPEKKAATVPSIAYRFTVQVGAFASEKNAGSLIEKMQKKGLDAFIEEDASKPLYRVLVGRFGNEKQASEQAKILREEGLKAVVRPGRG